MHLPILARRPDLFEVAALCDLSPGTLRAVADRYRIGRRHRTLDELLETGGIDAVMILTSGSHGAAAATAAAAGVPVFCEKPLCYLERYPAYREEVRVHDEQGTVALVFPSPYLLHAPTVLTVVESDDRSARTTRFHSTVEAFEQELVAFHRLVTAGEPAAAGVAEGRSDIVTCQLVVRRLAEHQGLELSGEALDR